MESQRNQGVVQIYDGLIADMRKEGYTLQEIGDKVKTPNHPMGVTKERVRQVLHRFYPAAQPRGMSDRLSK